MASLAETINGTLAGMKADRATLDAHCEQIREIFYPDATSFTTRQTAGEKLHQKIFDSSGEQAGEILAAGLQAMTCTEQWMALTTDDPDLDRQEDVAWWLEDTTSKMLFACNAPDGGFITNKHEQYMELVHFGTGPLFIGDRKGRPAFQSRALAQTYVAEGAERQVDTVYWNPMLTARQAVTLFGRDAGKQVVKDAEDPKKAQNLHEFVHAVYPRSASGGEQLTRGKLVRSNEMPFASCWVNVRESHLALESGFEEFPYSCPRLRKRASEAYGRSPAMKVLADCKMLQRAMRVQIRGVEKIVDPPWMVADDGVMSPLRVSPSATNVVRGMTMRGAGDPIRPLLSGGRPDLAEEFMNGIRERIENGFHVNLFQFARDPKMTATQYLGITEQTMQAMSPMLGRMQTEDLGPMVERVFAVMYRGGQIAEPPEALSGRKLRVKYVSPIAKQQRIGEARAFAQWYEIMGPAIALDPEAADIVDASEGGKVVAEAIGLRKTVLRSPEKIAAMRQARQQAVAEQAQAESLRATAETGAKVIGALPALKQGLGDTEAAGNA